MIKKLGPRKVEICPRLSRQWLCCILSACHSHVPRPLVTLLSVLKADHIGDINGCPYPLTVNGCSQWEEARGWEKGRQGTQCQPFPSHGAPADYLPVPEIRTLSGGPLRTVVVVVVVPFFLGSSHPSLSLPLECQRLPFSASPGASHHPFWFAWTLTTTFEIVPFMTSAHMTQLGCHLLSCPDLDG